MHVAPCHVPLDGEAGGVANMVRALVLQRQAAGRRTHLVCTTTELGRQVAEPGLRRVSDVLTVEVVRQHGPAALGPPSAMWRAMARAVEACGADADADAGPPVVHLHSCFSAAIDTAALHCRAHGLRYVATPHGKLAPALLRERAVAKRAWLGLVGRANLRAAAAVVGLNVEEAADIARVVGRAVPLTVPNGFDAAAGGAGPGRAGPGPWTDRRPYVLFLGYLEPRKRPELLVEAFAEAGLAATHDLVLAGPDAYGHADRVRRRIASLGLVSAVQVPGRVDGAAKWDLLRGASVLGLPSHGEGMPIVALEALGAGLPLLVSPEANCSELVAHGAGVMVADATPAAWGAALSGLLRDPARRHRLAAAARAAAGRYTWQAVSRRWEAVYLAIAERPRGLRAST